MYTKREFRAGLALTVMALIITCHYLSSGLDKLTICSVLLIVTLIATTIISSYKIHQDKAVKVEQKTQVEDASNETVWPPPPRDPN